MNAWKRIAGPGSLLLALVATMPSAAQSLDPLVNGEALVRLVPGADIEAFNATYGTSTLRSIPGRNIHLLQLPPGSDPEQFQASASQDPATMWVELNYYGQVPEARGRCFYGPPSPEAAPYFEQAAWSQINLAAAQDQTIGTGVTVAVVDSGVDAAHEAFLGTTFLPGWNFIDDTADTTDVGNGLDDDGDLEIDEMTGHGTHVTGLVRMVAPGAAILPVKVLDSDGNSDNFILAQGIFYAIDQGADVINVSVGSTYNSDAVLDAVLEAQSLGIVVAAAGGNVNLRTPEEYPALNAGAMGIASVDAQDVKSWFSNYHENMALCAPGTQIVSTLPGNLYAPWDGSSMSAPLVSGAAALVLSRHPEWPADASRANNVRVALMQSAVDVDPLNPDYAGMLGAGRLDVAGALDVVAAFDAAVDYPVGAGPEQAVALDLDEDGLPELAVANAGAASVAVLPNLGAGVFGAAVFHAVGPGPLALAAADFNADGHADLAVAGSAGDVTILLGAGDGSLIPGDTLSVGNSLHGIAAGPFVGDSAVDLAVADDNADAVRLLRNLGDGSLTEDLVLPVGARPRDILAADLNADGRLDLATANRDANSVSVLLALPEGGFAPAASFSVGSNPRALTSADFDGDGDVDLATANHASRDMTLLWNDGNGAFPAANTVTLEEGIRPLRLAAADVDCDGDQDLLSTLAADTLDAVAVLLGRGDGTFLQPVNYPVAPEPLGLLAADLDADGDSELVAAGSLADAVSVLLNRGCPASLPGDLNCDGMINAFDIDPFLLALTDPAGYQAAFPDCDLLRADVNGDGMVNAFDIDPFITLLTD